MSSSTDQSLITLVIDYVSHRKHLSLLYNQLSCLTGELHCLQVPSESVGHHSDNYRVVLTGLTLHLKSLLAVKHHIWSASLTLRSICNILTSS